MQSEIEPAMEHLFSRAGRMIALARLYVGLDHPGIENIDIKRADAQIKAIHALEKLDSARAIEQRMDAIESQLADMAAMIATTQGSASREHSTPPPATPAGRGPDTRD